MSSEVVQKVEEKRNTFLELFKGLAYRNNAEKWKTNIKNEDILGAYVEFYVEKEELKVTLELWSYHIRWIIAYSPFVIELSSSYLEIVKHQEYIIKIEDAKVDIIDELRITEYDVEALNFLTKILNIKNAEELEKLIIKTFKPIIQSFIKTYFK